MKNNKKIIGLILALFLLFMPTIYFYFQKDACLDTGGSWNQKEKKCEKSEKTETRDPENLLFDLSVLENTNFSEKDIADFKGFFAQIPTELTKDVNIHEKKLKKTFLKKV